MTHQELIWAAFKAGELNDREMVHLQALTRPACACGKPTAPIDDGLCVECYARREGVRLPSGDSAMQKRGRR